LACWVIAIGRECGTAIGTEPIDTTRLTSNRSTTARTASTKASQRLRDVVFVDGVRTPFGKDPGPEGHVRRDPAPTTWSSVHPRAHAAQPRPAAGARRRGRHRGHHPDRRPGPDHRPHAALLAGLPKTVPGYAIDRMCAGALTAVTTTAAASPSAPYDVVIAGGVEHMGHHPMGEGVDPNPRIIAEKLVDPEALVMGNTAENLHDRYPASPRSAPTRSPWLSQDKLAKAYANGKIQPDLVPVATRSADKGWGLATDRRADAPGHHHRGPGVAEDAVPPARPGHRRQRGRLNDGATACLLAAEDVAASSACR
jgi:acetyl-CoA acyltransferase